MKLRFKGGSGKRWVDGEQKTVELDSLTQLFEECEYTWPKVGTVLSVTDEVGAWLQYKVGHMLERLPDDPKEAPKGAPRAIVAIDVEQQERAKAEKAKAAAEAQALASRVAELEDQLEKATRPQAAKHPSK